MSLLYGSIPASMGRSFTTTVYVVSALRRRGIFRALYDHARREAQAQGAAGLRLYVDVTNTHAQAVYASLGMKGDHYRVFEDMFVEPARNP